MIPDGDRRELCDLIEKEFNPSAWFWDNPYYERIHSCFRGWLAENKGRERAQWTSYRCPHNSESSGARCRGT